MLTGILINLFERDLGKLEEEIAAYEYQISSFALPYFPLSHQSPYSAGTEELPDLRNSVHQSFQT